MTTPLPQPPPDFESSQHAETQEAVRLLLKLLPWLRALIVGAFFLGAWQATIEFRMQASGVRTAEHAKALAEVTRWKDESNGLRFTSSDWHAASMALTDTLNQHDKRLTRSEDTLSRIEKAIERIERKIDGSNKAP